MTTANRQAAPRAPAGLTLLSSPSSPFPPLPADRSGFVGRRAELASLTALLERPEHRLLVITGPGGIGKTRLALALARAAGERYRYHAAFVSLVGISDPELVPAAITNALGITVPLSVAPLTALIDALAGHEGIVVVDNFEQVVEAAPVLGELVASAPGIRVVVTSRVRLGLRGEQRFPLLGFPLPGPDEMRSVDALAGNPAVELFSTACAAIDPRFRLTADNAEDVVAICRQLEGWPLALELAAARTLSLPAAALRARLGSRLTTLTGGPYDSDQRFRSLRAAIDWSYHLLTPLEASATSRLAVFRGGCTLRAAGHVIFASDAPDVALEIVTSLVEKSLLSLDVPGGEEPRYSMLETIREYARERLDAEGALHETSDRHAAYFSEMARVGSEGLKTSEAPRWITQLNDDRDNLRAALDWYDRSSQHDRFLELATWLATYWDYQGELDEGRRWLERALDRSELTKRSVIAQATAWLAWFDMRQDRIDDAERRVRESLSLLEQLEEPDSLAYARSLLGSIRMIRGDIAGALGHFDQSRLGFTSSGNIPGYTEALLNLSEILSATGDAAGALALAEEALTLATRHDIQTYIAVSLVGISGGLRETGDASRALDMGLRALNLADDLGFEVCAADAVVSIAAAAAATGRFDDAARLLGEAEQRLARTGSTRFFFQTRFLNAVETTRRHLGTRRYRQESSRGLGLDANALSEFVRSMSLNPTRTMTRAQLTPREQEVLALLTEGKSDREIAEAMFISYRTANSYVARILEKLDVPSRTAAAALAIREELV